MPATLKPVPTPVRPVRPARAGEMFVDAFYRLAHNAGKADREGKRSTAVEAVDLYVVLDALYGLAARGGPVAVVETPSADGAAFLTAYRRVVTQLNEVAASDKRMASVQVVDLYAMLDAVDAVLSAGVR